MNKIFLKLLLPLAVLFAATTPSPVLAQTTRFVVQPADFFRLQDPHPTPAAHCGADGLAVCLPVAHIHHRAAHAHLRYRKARGRRVAHVHYQRVQNHTRRARHFRRAPHRAQCCRAAVPTIRPHEERARALRLEDGPAHENLLAASWTDSVSPPPHALYASTPLRGFPGASPAPAKRLNIAFDTLHREHVLPASAHPPEALPSAVLENKSLNVQINHTSVLELAAGFKRISVANGEIVEAVAVSSTELVLNGKAAGETSLVLWDKQALRHEYTVHVTSDQKVLDAIRDQLVQEVGPLVTLTLDGPSLFLKGTVQTATAAERAFAIASAYPAAKVVNLLRVTVPSAQPQILLKVRFADVDRSLSSQYGINLFGLNPTKGIGTTTTGQFGAPPNLSQIGPSGTATLTNLLNIMYYRPDLNLGAVLQDLEAKNVLQILAEPNLLTLSGHQASFLAGGEFPFPTIQGGASGVGQITVQFKEFGIRLSFLPTITPRGTIHLVVMPEVSSLDYSNGLTVSGFTVPGLATKRVTTDIELATGQSFAIAGLLDNQLTENVDRLPGFANIPVLGSLFKSRSMTKNHSELLVVVTPELVNPLPQGEKDLTVPMGKPFLPGQIPPRLGNPADAQPIGRQDVLPIEELNAIEQAEAAATQSTMNPSGVTPPSNAASPTPQIPASSSNPK